MQKDSDLTGHPVFSLATLHWMKEVRHKGYPLGKLETGSGHGGNSGMLVILFLDLGAS